MNNPNPPDEPKTLEELIWYIRRYESGIYVRDQQPDGRWGNSKLSDMPPQRWAKYVAAWLEQGRIPCRMRKPDDDQ